MRKLALFGLSVLLTITAAIFVVTVVSASGHKRSREQEETTEVVFYETEVQTEEVTTPEETTTEEVTTEPVIETETESETETEEETEAEAWPVAFQQSDPRWCDIPYGYGNWAGTNPAYLGRGGRNGFGGGCGVFATINAAYYLNHSFIEPAELAEYAVKYGFRISGKGTDEGLAKSFINSRGSDYGITYIRTARRLSSIRDELMSGAVAVAHLNGHYIAVVDYDNETGQFLVLDSAAIPERGTFPDGIRWMTEKEFTGKMELSESDGALQVFGRE